MLKPTLILTLLLSSLPATAGSGGGLPEDSRGRMRAFRINGYDLSGAEYWPFTGSAPFHYPEDVLWGFYPDTVRDQAVDCAWIAYLDIQAFFRSNPARLRKAVSLGATNRFYLWVNDYGLANDQRSRRAHKLWHSAATSRVPDDYGAGFWKWESTLTQDGTCLTPQGDQIAQALDEAIQTLLSRPRTPATGATH